MTLVYLYHSFQDNAKNCVPRKSQILFSKINILVLFTIFVVFKLSSAIFLYRITFAQKLMTTVQIEHL